MLNLFLNIRFIYKLFSFSLLLSLISGCSSYGLITNLEHDKSSQNLNKNYSIKSAIQSKPQGDITLVLALSGGGTRAAALSYGVLQALEETQIKPSKKVTLLDEVDVISSVSGGSFTAAYYGIYGKRTFKNYKQQILMTDIEAELISAVLNPFRWFSSTGRTQLAIDYYNLKLFGGKTFKDLNKPGHPLILINASDLTNGVRFSFVQEYFNLICSDIKDMPIGKAVAASSAVPILFNPVVLKNYQPCENQASKQLKLAQQAVYRKLELEQAINGLSEYVHTPYPFLHLVDGGITDNLGLRAIYEAVELSGGPKAFLKKMNKQKTKHIVAISVDASTKSSHLIKQTNKVPTALQSINAMSDIQIHRYNSATTELFKQSLGRWSKQLSTTDTPVKNHFIQLNFEQLSEEEQVLLNQIPTSLTLTEEQIELLIQTGKKLLKQNPVYIELLNDLNRSALVN